MIRIALLISIGPADLSNQEKKTFQSDTGRRERADNRKAERKAREAKGKAKASA